MKIAVTLRAGMILMLLAAGCNKPANPGFRSQWEQEKANRAEFEGRTEDAQKHRERAEAEAQKRREYEAWKRANGK